MYFIFVLKIYSTRIYLIMFKFQLCLLLESIILIAFHYENCGKLIVLINPTFAAFLPRKNEVN